MRNVASAQHLEGGPIVLIVAHADHPAWLDLVEQLGKRRALAGKLRMHLDDLATLRAVESGVLDQGAQPRHRFLAADLRVAEMNRRAGRLDLEPSTRHRRQNLRRLGVESLQSTFLVGRRRRQSAVTDEPNSTDRHQPLQLGAGAAAEDDDQLQQV